MIHLKFKHYPFSMGRLHSSEGKHYVCFKYINQPDAIIFLLDNFIT